MNLIVNFSFILVLLSPFTFGIIVNHNTKNNDSPYAYGYGYLTNIPNHHGFGISHASGHFGNPNNHIGVHSVQHFGNMQGNELKHYARGYEYGENLLHRFENLGNQLSKHLLPHYHNVYSLFKHEMQKLHGLSHQTTFNNQIHSDVLGIHGSGAILGGSGNTVAIPRPYSVPVPVDHPIPIPIRVPVPIKVDQPYPLHIPQPYAVPIDKPIPYKVEKTIPVHVSVPYKVPVPIKVPIPIQAPYPVHVPHPVPVHIQDPIIVKKPVPILINEGHTGFEHFGVKEHGFGGSFSEYGHIVHH